jgi:DNA-binding MltR family transcriptional regulator
MRYSMAKIRRPPDFIQQGVGHGGLDFGIAITSETDRGCALVVAEFLSDCFEQYIRRTMEVRGATEGDIRDFLTGSVAPLNNFSLRVKTAYWFGLIGKTTYEALESIREIRNQCAHRAGSIDFADAAITEYIRRLEKYWEARGIPGSFIADCVSGMVKVDEQSGFSPQRITFMRASACAFMSIRMLAVNPTDVLDRFTPDFPGGPADART